MTDDIVEKVARALCFEEYAEEPDRQQEWEFARKRELWRSLARAAIAAMEEAGYRREE
ncbi:MAG: hypothetical protein KIT20_12260 [Alphaproteobacteria bacterium]|nr:hypothetical protein [Alphaproteobacteria bacterium]